MAIRMAQNKDKYGKYNWKQSIDLDSIKQALFRHVLAVLKGDTSEDHLAAIACNSMVIKYHERQNK